MATAYQAPELAGLFSSFQGDVQQLYADIDRASPNRDIFVTVSMRPIMLIRGPASRGLRRHLRSLQ
ncbi:MAG: hypothetical protein JWP47_2498 [Polaromonas sp.]|jgi:hypothetical protein|nr:hypothetical protein [Polaromonas sp.]